MYTSTTSQRFLTDCGLKKPQVVSKPSRLFKIRKSLNVGPSTHYLFWCTQGVETLVGDGTAAVPADELCVQLFAHSLSHLVR